MSVLALFQSTRAVIKADRLLRYHQVTAMVIPVPRQISSECGMALQINEQDRERIEQLLSEAGIGVTFHTLER